MIQIKKYDPVSIAELREVLREAGAKVVALQHKLIQYAVTEGIFIQCDYRALPEVIWASFLGIVYVEMSPGIWRGKPSREVSLNRLRGTRGKDEGAGRMVWHECASITGKRQQEGRCIFLPSVVYC